MVTYASYTQSNSDYDYAINGVPFFSAASADAPYGRSTADWQRQQQDQSTSPGEQSLNDWWRRSQASFHYGAGLDFFDPAQEVVAYGRARTMPLRFQDSRNCNVWTKGEVSMLRGTARASTAGAGVKVPVRGYASNDLTQQGVFYSNATGTVHKYSIDGTAVTMSGGGWSSGLDVIDIDCDGFYLYAMNGAGVYVCGLGNSAGATTNINTMTFSSSPSRGVIRAVKDRLVIGANASLYNAAPGSGSALPSAFYTHPNPQWTWTGVASSGDAIFYSGYSGNQSAVFASILETASAGSVPTVSVPFTVAELPPGEVIYSMITYLNTYIILGTSQGVRVGLIGDNGQIQLGPLSVQTDSPVYAVVARGNFVWAGGQSAYGFSGLYRLDLSSPLSSDELRFPYARDLEVTSASTPGAVTGIAPLGLTDRMAFGVTGSGLWVESATDKTPNDCWLQTGRIRFDTWEDKIFQYLKAQVKPSPGSLFIAVSDENDVALPILPDTSTVSVKNFSVDAADGEPHQYVSYGFYLSRDGTDRSKGAIFKGYQVLAQPANVRQRSIRLALLCYPKEVPTGRRRVERSTWDRITGLETAERKGAVVRFQDFGTGESRLVRIEKTEFVAQSTGEQRWDRQNLGGILLVTLTTVD